MREITKVRLNFTLDKDVALDLDKFSRSMRVKKSAFVEQLLIDGLTGMKTLFGSDVNLGDAVVHLSKQLVEMKETIEKNNPELLNARLGDARNDYRDNNKAGMQK